MHEVEIRNIGIFIELKKLQELVNDAFDFSMPELKPHKINLPNGYEVALYKGGNISVKLDENQLFAIFPLGISTQVQLPIGSPSLSGLIQLHCRINYQIGKDLKITTSTNIDQVDWLKGPILEPAFVDYIIPDSFIKSLVDDALPGVIKKLDEIIYSDLNLKEIIIKEAKGRIVEMVLSQHQKMPTMLKLSELELYNLHCNTEYLGLAANAKVNILFGANIEMLEDAQTNLPNISYSNDLFVLEFTTFNIKLKLDQLGYPILEFLKANPAIERAIQCTIEKILIKNIEEGGGIGIALKLKGALNGALSIAGKPILDSDAYHIDIENLSFHFSGKNILSSLKGNIALSVAKSYIRKQFPLNLKSHIDVFTEQLNQIISNVNLRKGLFLKGQTENWQIDQLSIVEDEIVISIISKINLKLV